MIENVTGALRVLLGKGQFAEAMDLIGNNSSQIHERSYKGESLLHIATKHDAFDMCRELISRGVDVGIKDQDRNTALVYAVRRASAKTVNSC